MFIGIDLGTSGVKVIVLDRKGEILDSVTKPLAISRPQPLWSEQCPLEWWEATCGAMDELAENLDLSSVESIGLSGQMHGAVTLDNNGDVIRPAILWNDGRCFEECHLLETLVPDSRTITGNIMMPGFTAPKIKWIETHEPDNHLLIDKVLLPKDYLRYRLCGEFASDMSDSAGTMWLDVESREWNEELLKATGLGIQNMPKLYEGNEITGFLHQQLASKWRMRQVSIVAGGGDNAAGAIGVGVTKPGEAMLSLGTSGVYFAVSDGMVANTESALHSFCHALPNTWHGMSVILSAASCLDWVAKLTGKKDVAELLKDVEANSNPLSEVIFLPYLSGERTPHNDPNAKGVFWGMTHDTKSADLGLAVLQGVGFALADGFEAMHKTGLAPKEVNVIGGGAKSRFWRQMLADITGMRLVFRAGGDVGPALGAARLARLAVDSDLSIDQICTKPDVVESHEPCTSHSKLYQQRHVKFKALYQQLKSIM